MDSNHQLLDGCSGELSEHDSVISDSGSDSDDYTRFFNQQPVHVFNHDYPDVFEDVQDGSRVVAGGYTPPTQVAERRRREDTPYPYQRGVQTQSWSAPVGQQLDGCQPAVPRYWKEMTQSGHGELGRLLEEEYTSDRADNCGATTPVVDSATINREQVPRTPRKETPSSHRRVSFAPTPDDVRLIPPKWASTPLSAELQGLADQLAQNAPCQPCPSSGKQRYSFHQFSDSGFGSLPTTPNNSRNSSSISGVNSSSYLDSLLSCSGGGLSPVSRCVFRPQKFKGINWAGYKWHFLSVAQVNGWSQAEAARMLKASLDDEVALGLKKALRRNDVSLDVLFQALDERYDVPGPDYVLKGKVRRTIQRSGQTVDQYQTELIKVLSGRLDTEESEVALEQFIYGLSDPRMQKYVAKRMPDDLHDALRLAREYEETSSWVNGVAKHHKRIGMVTATASPELVATVTNNPKEQSTTSSLSEQLELLIKKVEALEARNQQYRNNNGNGKKPWFNRKDKWKKSRDDNESKVATSEAHQPTPAADTKPKLPDAPAATEQQKN